MEILNEKHSLMTERLLHEAILEQFTDGETKRVAERDGFHFHEVHELHLEYKKIRWICNLWDFTSLTTLNLCYNVIEKIEGLESLVNLKWLNLSCNRIKNIEGLESLQKLEELNLNNNQISVIKNMASLKKLTALYIANNRIRSLASVTYLQRFEDLVILTMYGNPVCKNVHYKDKSIVACLLKLDFLDHVLIDKSGNDTSTNDRISKSTKLKERKKKELQEEQQRQQASQKREAELRLHKDAFVEFLKGSHLFESMFEDDPEIETLNYVPGMTHLFVIFKGKMVELCEQLFELGLAEHKRRESELNSFNSGRMQDMAHYQQEAMQIREKCVLQHKQAVEEWRKMSDPDEQRVKLKQCHDAINQLSNDLMTLEVQLFTRLEDIIKKLVISISAMIGNFIESAQGIFTQCRDLEDNYYQKMREVAAETLGLVAKDDVKCLPDNVKTLFKDKEAVKDALTVGHDNRLMKINDRETELTTRANAWKVSLLKEIELKANKESHERMTGIHRYADYLRAQLQEQHHGSSSDSED